MTHLFAALAISWSGQAALDLPTAAQTTAELCDADRERVPVLERRGREAHTDEHCGGDGGRGLRAVQPRPAHRAHEQRRDEP